ncbi:MAG: aminotransferase class I/II-fold pyridoxal phosphate-dependent enzyme [Candidatus Gastranaerophilales bacterium]|nr:aminotransferase class I/II-fold pyridoxal phosphate-dependent enzyme [Candidatus Gastranaerophilales bacterium]
MEKDLFNLCNNKIANMSNYIMFTIKARQMELTPELKAKNRAPIALSMGAPVEKVPEYVIKKSIEYMNVDSLHTYSTPKGEAKFLEAVKNRMKARFNVDLDSKSEIFSLIGSKEGISNLVKALVNPKENEKEQDVIMVPNPGYASYSQMINVANAKFYGIDLNKENNYQPNLEEVLSKYIKEGNDPSKIKAIVVNYPNNPLGCTCDFEYLQHCVDFCNKHNIILISDNAYCEMYYDEKYKPHSALECKGAMDCCIEMYSFSKSYAMTGWRIGYAVGNKKLITMLSRQKSTVDTGIFKVLQYAAADLLESQEGQEYIDKQNIKFKNKLQKFVDGLNSLGYKVEMPKATFYLWMEIPKRYNDCSEFAKDMLETSGIVIVPGTAFDKNATRYVRLSVVASDDDSKEVIKRMKEDGFYFEK